MFLNNFGLVSDDTVFKRINETQNLKQIHTKPFSNRNRVMAKGPKKLVFFLSNYFVFKKLLIKFHKKLFGFMETSWAFSNSDTHLLIQR